MRRPALLLLFLCFLSFFLGLGAPAISDADEAYYAESAREMVERGDWLTPFYNYEYRWQKPVLYYWLTAITYLVFGIGEFSARFWSAASGLGLAFATWGIGRRLSGRDDVGWLAGAITATCFGCFALARMALPDLPLAFFITVAIGAALDDRWPLAGLAAGLGFLAKGPLALLIPAIVLLPIWWTDRGTWRLRAGPLAAASAVFALVALPWYLAMTATHGTAYIESFFIGDNLERFATDRFNEPRSYFFYVPIVLGGLLPWTAYLLMPVRGPWRERLARWSNFRASDRRLLIWVAMPLLFFSMSIGKQPRYVLPLLPPLAILIARRVCERIDAAGHGDRGAQRHLRIATNATAAFVVVLALLLVRARDLFVTVWPPLTWTAILAFAGCAGLLFVTARAGEWRRLPVRLAVVAALMLVAIQFGALGGLRPEPVERMAAHALAHRTADEPIGEYQVFVRNLVFYTGVKQHELPDDAAAVAFLRRPERVLLVVSEGDVARLETLARVRLRELARVRYLNTANLKLPALLSPLPDQDIQEVLLVSNR